MFKIISVGWECGEFFKQTIESVRMQNYPFWQLHVVDDGSDPEYQKRIGSWIEQLHDSRIIYTAHAENRGAVRNQYEGIRSLDPRDGDIVIFLDLDGDRLATPNVLERLLYYYRDDTLVTYGSYRPVPDPGGPVPVSPYPPEVVRDNSYRQYTQTHGTRYNHLRTAKWECLKQIPLSYFQFSPGQWLFSPTDLVVMMGCLELAGGRYKCIDETLLLYNDQQPHPDHTRNPQLNVEGSNYTFNLPPLEKLMFGGKWDPTVPSERRCEIIREYAKAFGIKNFVESGSADGDTCLALVDSFDQIHTVEIVPTVQQRTANRLSVHSHVHCYLGDTTNLFPGILDKINAPCLFWLDGHYCGSLEARGPKDTPVVEELEIIFATRQPHVILIDDARLFGSDPAYPSIEWVRNVATTQPIEFTFAYADDIIRIAPKCDS